MKSEDSLDPPSLHRSSKAPVLHCPFMQAGVDASKVTLPEELFKDILHQTFKPLAISRETCSSGMHACAPDRV